MLSVLIPVYNYDIRRLVYAIHKQLLASKITFEILCLDDHSENSISASNTDIEQLQNTSYRILNNNLGRVAVRQTLAKQAVYDWLLFLDADVMPTSDNFISNYHKLLSSGYDAIYGGFTYRNTPPKADHMLRWSYGKSKEQMLAIKRNQVPYKIVISGNFLIQKSLFIRLNSQITHKGYGYDNYFGALLKAYKSKVFHIDNNVFHLGLESNVIYLNKIEQSVDTLLILDKQNAINETENTLYNSYKHLKKLKLNYIFSYIYINFNSNFRKNLLSSTPNILVLQCYKLSYICYQDLNS